jgi:hypothetical protein
VADKQTVLKFFKLFVSKNTFTKLEFYDSLIGTKNALKFTNVHLHFQKIPGIMPIFPFSEGEGLRESEGWERKVREGRVMCSPKKPQNNLEELKVRMKNLLNQMRTHGFGKIVPVPNICQLFTQ